MVSGPLGGDSQKLLTQIRKIFFLTLGLKILRLFRLKVLFEADIIKGITIVLIIKYLSSMNSYFVKAPYNS